MTAHAETLTATDGHSFDILRAQPAADKAVGGLIILQEIFGLTPYLTGVCDYWATHGFEVIAPALFDRVTQKTVVPYNQPVVGRGLADQCALDTTMLDISACLEDLRRRHTAVTALGFCWGGGLAYEAASRLPLSAAVCVYPTRMAAYIDHTPKCPVQFHFGLHDDHVPPLMRARIAATNPNGKIHLYNAGHAFDRVPAEAASNAPSQELRQNIFEFLPRDTA